MNKPEYLARIYRILKPGGVWRAQAWSVQESPLSTYEAEQYKIIQEDFKIPSLLPASKIEQLLNEIGFVDTEAIDITPLVLPTASHVIRHSYIPLVLIKLHLDWLFFTRDPQRRRNHQGHFRAGFAWSRGLQKGYFLHYLYSGSKRL